MPIVYKGLKVTELLDLLEVAPADVTWLNNNAVTVTIFATQIRFARQDLSIDLPCKLDHLVALKAGTLGALAYKAMRLGVLSAIKQLQKKVDDEPQNSPYFVEEHTGTSVVPAGIMGLLAKNKSQPAFKSPADLNMAVPPASPAHAEFPLNLITSAPTTVLASATQMYQPVRGTSEGTRYFLVAASDELRIACRYKGVKLSVRIEGPHFAKNKARLTACGFTSVYADYASMHLEVANTVIAAKALGAVLLGLGVKLSTPFPDLALLHNKGN